MLKIAVYASTFNQEQFVERWREVAKDADLLLIADVGSSDKTYSLAKSLGITSYRVDVNPWRLDVARNAALALIPEQFDICIQLDLDEVLMQNWRVPLEAAWHAGNFWPVYKHLKPMFSNKNERVPTLGQKIHPRKGFVWRYPTASVIAPLSIGEIKRRNIELIIEKTQAEEVNLAREQQILEAAVVEYPEDWNMSHLLTRNYWQREQWSEALTWGLKALKLRQGDQLQRAITAIWSSEAAFRLGKVEQAKTLSECATSESLDFYEAWHWRANLAHIRKDWLECFSSAMKIETLARQNNFYSKPEVWSWSGYDLIALSAHYLGKHELAVLYGEKALRANQDIPRLNSNLSYYKAGLGSKKSFAGTIIRDSNEPSVEVKVLNLDYRHDRREQFLNQPDVEFDFISAFDGSQLNELLKMDVLTSQQRMILKGLIRLPVNSADALSGTYGKWMSHIKIWNQLAFSSDPNARFLILHDDIVLRSNFLEFYRLFQSKKIPDWPVTSVGENIKVGEIPSSPNPVADVNDFQELIESKEFCEGAYLINKQGATMLLEQMMEELKREALFPPIKLWLEERRYSLKLRSTKESVAFQYVNSTDSDINGNVR